MLSDANPSAVFPHDGCVFLICSVVFRCVFFSGNSASSRNPVSWEATALPLSYTRADPFITMTLLS